MNYRIYGNNRLYGWEVLTTLYQEELIDEFLKLVSAEDYDKIMIIAHDIERNSDIPYDVIYLDRPTILRKKR